MNVPYEYQGDDRTICFLLSEVLYALMFGRVVLILRAGFNYTPYCNFEGIRASIILGFRPSIRFAVKSMFNKYKFLTTVFVFITPMALLVAILVRIFERPVEEITNLNWAEFWNSLYFSLITLTTVGYGHYYPTTTAARIVVMIAVLFIGFILSSIVASISSDIEFQTGE